MTAKDRIKKYLIVQNFREIRENCFIYETISFMTIKVILFNDCIRILIITFNKIILTSDLIKYGNKTVELCSMIDNLVKSFEYFKFEG